MKVRAYKSGNMMRERSDKSTWSGIKTLWKLLNDKEKHRMIVLFILILVLSFIEMMGISSVLPFLAVASKPSLVTENKYLFTEIGRASCRERV